MNIDPTWRLLEPGLYADDQDTLHVDAAAYLIQNGYAPTLENQEMLLRAFRKHSGVPVRFDLDGREQ